LILEFCILNLFGDLVLGIWNLIVIRAAKPLNYGRSSVGAVSNRDKHLLYSLLSLNKPEKPDRASNFSLDTGTKFIYYIPDKRIKL